jgi:hypothetical protein
MKRTVLYNLLLLPLTMLIATWGMSQSLAPDQNPDYMVSQSRYMGMADSLTSTHGETIQETYKAIDWMADRQQRRDDRRAFRRQLRLERARYGWSYNDYSNYNPTYSYYPRYSGNYWYNYQPYHNYYRSRWNNWNLVPLAATAATVGWLLTR